MTKHHTKNKGDIGVLKVKADLAEKGYAVGSLDTEHYPFDVISYKEGKFKRIQVKYRSLVKGKLEIRFKSCWSTKSGLHTKPTDKKEVDVYAIYCPNNDTCYYFDPKSFDKSITLRIDDPVNNQTSKVNLASDYLNLPE